jgi:hypothetical protein
MYDPRQIDSSVQTIHEAFDGTKSSKVFWIPKFNWIGATGFSKDAKRQLKIWDLKNLKDAIFKLDIDQVASVLMPYYDNDNSILYLAGKGDGTISYYEIVNDDRKLYTLAAYRSNESQKGGGWVPKRGLDPMKCEIERFLKLTNTKVTPIPFVVPRKAGNEVFQSDIFPDAPIGKPSLQAQEWISGTNKNPILGSLDPAKRQDLNNDDDIEDSNNNGDVNYNKKKTYEELEYENKLLKSQLLNAKQELSMLKGDNNNDYKQNDEQDNQQQQEEQQDYNNEE